MASSASNDPAVHVSEEHQQQDESLHHNEPLSEQTADDTAELQSSLEERRVVGSSNSDVAHPQQRQDGTDAADVPLEADSKESGLNPSESHREPPPDTCLHSDEMQAAEPAMLQEHTRSGCSTPTPYPASIDEADSQLDLPVASSLDKAAWLEAPDTAADEIDPRIHLPIAATSDEASWLEALDTAAEEIDSQIHLPIAANSDKASWSEPSETAALETPDSDTLWEPQSASTHAQLSHASSNPPDQLDSALSSDEEGPPATMSRSTTAGEDDLSDRWQRRKRHFFILTAAGKPVFSRYGDEHALAGFMAIIQAMMSVMHDQGDKLQSMVTGTHVIAFALHGPLYMVAVSSLGEPAAALHKQLSRLYQQIIFIVTTSLERVCQRKPSYDVRALLGGSWATLRAVIRGFSRDPGWLIGAFPTLPLPASERRELTEALQEAVKASGAMYGVILADALVVAVDHPKHVGLHPWDLQLLINFIRSNDSYRYRFGESFSPVCLPHFQANAFLHAYIRYLDPDAGLCLVLLSPSSEAFYALSDARGVLEERVAAAGLMAALKRRVGDPSAGYMPLDVLPKATGGGPAGSTALWHFVLKLSGGRGQYLSPAYREPLDSEQLRKDMVRALARLHCSMWPQGGSAQGATPRRLHWQADSQFALLGTVDREAELYLVLDPLTDKAAAMKLADALRKYLLDKTRAADIFLST